MLSRFVLGHRSCPRFRLMVLSPCITPAPLSETDLGIRHFILCIKVGWVESSVAHFARVLTRFRKVLGALSIGLIVQASVRMVLASAVSLRSITVCFSVASVPTGGIPVSCWLSNGKFTRLNGFPIRRLQTIVHSIMSARILFHVMETTFKDISHAESSLEAVTTQCHLTSHIEMESVTVSPPDSPEEGQRR